MLLILSRGGFLIHFKKPSPNRSERTWGGDDGGEASPSPSERGDGVGDDGWWWAVIGDDKR